MLLSFFWFLCLFDLLLFLSFFDRPSYLVSLWLVFWIPLSLLVSLGSFSFSGFPPPFLLCSGRLVFFLPAVPLCLLGASPCCGVRFRLLAGASLSFVFLLFVFFLLLLFFFGFCRFAFFLVMFCFFWVFVFCLVSCFVAFVSRGLASLVLIFRSFFYSFFVYWFGFCFVFFFLFALCSFGRLFRFPFLCSLFAFCSFVLS